jgi:hypothetical protein
MNLNSISFALVAKANKLWSGSLPTFMSEILTTWESHELFSIVVELTTSANLTLNHFKYVTIFHQALPQKLESFNWKKPLNFLFIFLRISNTQIFISPDELTILEKSVSDRERFLQIQTWKYHIFVFVKVHSYLILSQC